jgi:hypothetical protein
MHESIRAHFQELEDAVQPTTLPADRKEAIGGSIKRLEALYTQFRLTNESRYFDEIARVVQWMLKDLEACPQAQQLDATFRQKLWHHHEELGLPRLALKPASPPPGSKKARKK